MTQFSKWPPAKWNYVFAYYSPFRLRDKILVSKPMFFWMKNPMMTLKINMTLGYLLVNSEFKMAVLEININDINWSMGPMDPTCTHQERMKTYLILLLGPIPTWKVDATITKLGWTTTRNVWNISYFVTRTYPNMKSGCRHHQIGMDYLYDAIFKIAASEVKLRFLL